MTDKFNSIYAYTHACIRSTKRTRNCIDDRRTVTTDRSSAKIRTELPLVVLDLVREKERIREKNLLTLGRTLKAIF